MTRIDDIFSAARSEGRTLLMPFLTAGYPQLDVTERIIAALEGAGASIIEVGFPFSDPIADGPVISASMHEALEAGVTPRRIFDAVGKLRPTTGLGLVAMVSESIVHRIGPERFMDDAVQAGFDGLIVPDVDLHVAEDLRAYADARGLSFTLLVAPTTAKERIERITALCSGFVYLLADVGVTGERAAAPQIAGRVEEIRSTTALPISVGFGIASAEHVRVATSSADAAIVGSALVRRIGSAKDPVREATAFVQELADGLSRRDPIRSP